MPRPTLIVVDVQQALNDPSWGERNNPDAERNIAAALAAWRAAEAPIIHVRDRSRDPDGLFQPGTPAFDYKPEARPVEGEPEITKSANCAFVGTDLEQRLRRDGATTVAIVGLTTDHCCSSTARMAADLGFETWIVADAMATYERADLDGTPIPADTIHRASLASLNGEVGEVMPLATAIERLERAEPSSLDVVRAICRAWERGEYRDVSWAVPEIDYVLADGPEPGRWTGIDGMGEGWRSFLGAWEGARIAVDEYRALDDDRVLVLFNRQGRGKTSGLELQEIRSRGATLFHVRGGQVVKLVVYFSEENALHDLGLPA